MLWFWIMVVVRTLIMLGVDAGWWMVSRWVTKSVGWRFVASGFCLFQAIALTLLVADVGWTHSIPKLFIVAVVTWHYFGAVLLALVAAGLGVKRLLKWYRSRKRGVLEPENISGSRSELDGITRRDFVGTAVAMTPPLFNVFLTGACALQQSQLRIRQLALPVAGLPKGLDGATIVHLTDLHVGPFTSGQTLRKMVETTNRLRADLVVMTGDLINYEMTDLPEAIELLRSIESRHGLWMVEGNHDIFESGNRFEEQIKASGLKLLLDETEMVSVRGCPVQMLGLRWISLGMPNNFGDVDNASRLQLHQMLKKRHTEAFPILLAHHPHAFDAAAKAGLPLTLSGHTHGGQWMIGEHGVGSTFFRYWSGLYSRGQSNLVVSNGVGNVFPLRIGAPAEIVQVTLRCG